MSYWIIDLENGDWFACERKWNFILMQLLLNILKSDKNLIFIGQPAFFKIFQNLEKSCSAVLIDEVIVVHPSYNPSYICVKPSYTYFNRDTAWHKPFFKPIWNLICHWPINRCRFLTNVNEICRLTSLKCQNIRF